MIQTHGDGTSTYRQIGQLVAFGIAADNFKNIFGMEQAMSSLKLLTSMRWRNTDLPARLLLFRNRLYAMKKAGLTPPIKSVLYMEAHTLLGEVFGELDNANVLFVMLEKERGSDL